MNENDLIELDIYSVIKQKYIERDVLDEIRAEIEHLHNHPKLDFIKNDEIVDMVLEIIDKCKAESEVSDADKEK